MRGSWVGAMAGLACAGGAAVPDDAPVDCSTYGIEVPSVRAELDGAWDPGRARLVFFGGNQDVPVDCAFGATDFVNDTWEFSPACRAFRPIPDAGEVPSRRGRFARATDGERLYVGGGRFREGTSGDYQLRRDLWAFDFASDTWARLSQGEGPPARSNHAMAHLDGKLWVFGGNSSPSGAFFAPLDDLWTYDLAAGAWQEVAVAGPRPPARLFHAMATDGELLYAYGGGDANAFTGPFLADLWAFDPQTSGWTLLHDGAGGPQVPSDRFWANLEYDPVSRQLLLFGGHDNTSLGNTNQVYGFDPGTGAWSRLEQGDTVANAANGVCDFPADFVDVAPGSPERRNAGVSAMTADGRLLVFGGKTDCGLINDVWNYRVGDGWTLESPATAGEACVRASQGCSTLCF